MWSSQVLKKRRTWHLVSPSSLCHMGAQRNQIPDLSLGKHFQTYHPSFLATPATRRNWFMFVKKMNECNLGPFLSPTIQEILRIQLSALGGWAPSVLISLLSLHLTFPACCQTWSHRVQPPLQHTTPELRLLFSSRLCFPLLKIKTEPLSDSTFQPSKHLAQDLKCRWLSSHLYIFIYVFLLQRHVFKSHCTKMCKNIVPLFFYRLFALPHKHLPL